MVGELYCRLSIESSLLVVGLDKYGFLYFDLDTLGKGRCQIWYLRWYDERRYERHHRAHCTALRCTALHCCTVRSTKHGARGTGHGARGAIHAVEVCKYPFLYRPLVIPLRSVFLWITFSSVERYMIARAFELDFSKENSVWPKNLASRAVDESVDECRVMGTRVLTSVK